MIEHDEVPDNPRDGQIFKCSHCDTTFEFVELEDGLPGEWIDITYNKEEDTK